MTEELALLAAIVANPKEDAPRLVYADWLDEQSPTEVPCGRCNGKPRMYSFKPPTSTNWIQVWASTYECLACGGSGTTTEPDKAKRAEFIRVQIELAKIPDPPVDTTAGLRAAVREQQLAALLAWKSEWRGRYYDLRARRQQLLADPHNFVNWTPSVMHTGSRAGIRYETGGTVGLFGNGFESATFTRGFVSHITCTAADWLTHADELAWVPGATAQCPECGGDGTALALECGRCRTKSPPTRAECTISLCCGANVEHADCAACSGSGRVPRPFRGTEQPIERVTLTTVPGFVTCRGGLYARLSGRWKELAWGVGRNGGQLVEDLLAAEWPRITFDLPA